MSVEPVRKTLTVPLEPERAFDLFTHGIGSWWPLETHSRAGEVEGATVERVEFPTEPGRPILERLATGDAFPWGELAASEPPHRVVIAWKPNANPNPPTEVEVTFTADGEGTRIELEHRAWEALDDLAAEGRAGYDEGWDLVLGRYEAAANT